MSPLALEDLVLHRPQQHMTQPADMATCCPLRYCSSISKQRSSNQQPGKTRITRTSSKNIMPVLDTGHLLAFTSNTLDTGGGWEEEEEEWGREREGREGRSFRLGLRESCEGGEERRTREAWPHAPSVKRFSSMLALCPGQPVQVIHRAPTVPCCCQQSLWYVAPLVTISSLMLHFAEGLWRSAAVFFTLGLMQHRFAFLSFSCFSLWVVRIVILHQLLLS